MVPLYLNVIKSCVELGQIEELGEALERRRRTARLEDETPL